jgi:hypothetical protein
MPNSEAPAEPTFREALRRWLTANGAPANAAALSRCMVAMQGPLTRARLNRGQLRAIVRLEVARQAEVDAFDMTAVRAAMALMNEPAEWAQSVRRGGR